MNVNDENVILWLFDVGLTNSAPPLPLSHLQLLNIMLEREMEVESEVNSNIVPFPFNRVMFSNVTLSHDILPLP